MISFIKDKQVYRVISPLTGLSIKTLYRYLKFSNFSKRYNDKLKPIEDIIHIDFKYLRGKNFGIYIFFSNTYKKPIYWFYSNKEVQNKYIEGLKYLQSKWWKIRAVVSDILYSVAKRCNKNNILIQFCIFHQQMVVSRYIWRRRKHRYEANKELKEISWWLGKFKEEVIKQWLEDWYRRYKEWLNEKNIEWKLKHEKTIKAYKSIKRNIEKLYTYEKYKELNIPKTNNLLESLNAKIKEQKIIHRWISIQNLKKIIDYLLYYDL